MRASRRGRRKGRLRRRSRRRCGTSSAATRCVPSSRQRRRPIRADVATTEQNPLLEGLQVRRTPDPCALVIFGASGDLTKKKLFPALYSLAFRNLLPDKFAVVGVARTEESDEGFVERMKEAVQQHARDEFRDDVWDKIADGMRYVATDFADESGENHVAEVLNDLDAERGLE